MAKMVVRSGEVEVNNEVEWQRSRQLKVGDQVRWSGVTYEVVPQGPEA